MGGLGKEWRGLEKECILLGKSEFSWEKKNASLMFDNLLPIPDAESLPFTLWY